MVSGAANRPSGGGDPVDAGGWRDHGVGERLHELEDRVEDRLDRLEAAAIEAERETGHHEETVEEAKRHLLLRVGRIALGTVVLIAGILMLALPGPGMVTVFAGLVLLSRDVPFARRLMEKVRHRIPQDEEGRVPTSAIVSMSAVMVVAVGASVWFMLLR